MVAAPGVYSLRDVPESGISLRELLARPDHLRDLAWLQQMLQFAVQLEFCTIPPYLVAMWSIKDPASPASLFLFSIVLQEMLHMGITCNLMNTIGGTPVIDRRSAVPSYPTCLPGGVHPGLVVELRPISKLLVEQVFMEIEKPEHGPIAYFRGQTYPTIGAFYSAIAKAVTKLRPSDVTGQRQIELNRPDFQLTPISTIPEALASIELIKEQGEGTTSSPLYGPSPDDKAHYYLFGELYHEKALVEESSGHWSYTGDDRPFPPPSDIYPMAPIPAGGYPESRAFNERYSAMLHELQSAWNLGGVAGSTHLTNALLLMGELGPIARRLMQTEITPNGQTFGPAFQLV